MSERIILLTPDRNDRPELLEHCKYQMMRQSVQAFDHLVINFDAVPGVVDIVPRVRRGIQIAREAGADFCFIIENDDYYPDTYIEQVMPRLRNMDLVGCDSTLYYSLQENCFRQFAHPGRSSLYLTSFRISAFDDFIWPDDTMLYFDLWLWEKLKARKGYIKFGNQMPIGIKHGSGFTPGNYHNGIVNGKGMKGMIPDPGRTWLQKHTRKESFEFYKKFMPL